MALGACGGGGDDGGSPSGSDQPVGRAQPFPDPSSRTLDELRAGLGPGPLMAKSVSVLQPGRNRFAFALFDRTRRQIADTPAAVYVAPEGGAVVEGPYPARYRSLEVEEPHRSDSVKHDHDAAHSIYVADIPFKREGNYEVLGVTQLDQRVVGGTPVRVRVERPTAPPAVGDAAPRVNTPTRDEVRDLSEIDTREPPSTMHEDDLADVLGHRPVMLLFATPRLCRSRICGPVVDVLEQVKADHPDDAAYIHMEVWNGNSRDGGERPQVRAFGLPSEPWLFAIDAQGRVAARIEGAFSAEEAEEALREATSGR
ncbi:MAG TPA: hypothetical protein VF517_04900 [Thermoleophilaceae bacterium]